MKKIILILCLFVLLIGCHLDATYTMKGSVYFVNGNEIMFEDITGNLFSCYTKEDSPNVHIGENFILKFDNKGEEGDRTKHTLIDYGKYSFLCFVW